MATIIAKVQGGQPKELTASTLGEVKRLIAADNYQASINGVPSNDAKQELSDYDVVTLTEQVKGAYALALSGVSDSYWRMILSLI